MTLCQALLTLDMLTYLIPGLFEITYHALYQKHTLA
jgi:hypothetical protein